MYPSTKPKIDSKGTSNGKLNSMTSVAALVALSMVGAATQVSTASTTTETHVTKTADAKCGEAKCGADKAKKQHKTTEAKCELIKSCRCQMRCR